MVGTQHPYEIAETPKEEEIPPTVRSARFKNETMSLKDMEAYTEFWSDPCWTQDDPINKPASNIDDDTLTELVVAVLDSYPGACINLPALVDVAAQYGHVKPACYREFTERAVKIIRNSPKFLFVKGAGGGVMLAP